MIRKLLRITIPLSLLVLCVVPLSAQDPVLVDFVGGGGPFSSFYGDPAGDVVGYSFTADSTGFITALGVHNDGRTAQGQDGVLDSPHQVGLWDIGGTLLCDVTADVGDTLIGEFYYEDCRVPVPVTENAQYVLGALYFAADSDTYFSGPSSVTLDNISGTEGRFPDVGDLGFVFPGSASPGNLGRVGPNALFVPEPASLSLVAMGLLLLVRRR